MMHHISIYAANNTPASKPIASSTNSHKHPWLHHKINGNHHRRRQGRPYLIHLIHVQLPSLCSQVSGMDKTTIQKYYDTYLASISHPKISPCSKLKSSLSTPDPSCKKIHYVQPLQPKISLLIWSPNNPQLPPRPTVFLLLISPKLLLCHPLIYVTHSVLNPPVFHQHYHL